MADYRGIQPGYAALLLDNVYGMPRAQRAIEENVVALLLLEGHEDTLF